MAIISYKDTGLLLKVSENTVKGYGTAKGGNLYERQGGVPYEALPDLLRMRISLLKNKIETTKDSENKKELEKTLMDLRNHHHMVTQRSFEAVMIYIASLRKTPIAEEKGLSEKVLEPEEKQEVPEIVEEVSEVGIKEPESPVYHLKTEPKEEPKPKKTRKSSYPHLTEEELSMPLDDLVDLIVKKGDFVKYRAIYYPWKDGVFD